MSYSMRELFLISTIVAVLAAAVYSRSDLAILLTTLLFAQLILLGAAMAVVVTRRQNFWRGFAVVAIGSVLLSPYVELFEHLAVAINARVRPPVSWQLSTLPATLPPPPGPSFAMAGPMAGPSLPTSPTISPSNLSTTTYVAPAPMVYMTNYSSGTGIDLQLKYLLTVASAILFGLIAGAILEVLVAKPDRVDGQGSRAGAI